MPPIFTSCSDIKRSTSISSFFFYNDTATTEIYTFPYTTLFRSSEATKVAVITDSERNVKMMILDAKLMPAASVRSEEHTSELQSLTNLVCRLLLEKKKGIALHSMLGSEVAHCDRSPDRGDEADA